MKTILSLTRIRDLIIKSASYNRKIDNGEITGDYSIPDFWIEDEVCSEGDRLIIMCDTEIDDNREVLTITEYRIAQVEPADAEEIMKLFNTTEGFINEFVRVWNKECEGLKISLD